MKKKLIIAISVMLTLATLAVFALISGAEDVEPSLSIKYCNLSLEGTVHIWYAVDSNLEDENDVKLLIWTKPQTDGYTKGTESTVLDPQSEKVEIQGDDSLEYYTAFVYDKLAAKQMTDVVYARAYVEVNGKAYYSPLNKYSILQYAYSKLGKLNGSGTSDEKLKTTLTKMLEYGASTQELFDYKTTRLATDDWYFIAVSGGTLEEDGAKHGLYLKGDMVTLNADPADPGMTFVYWADSAGVAVSITPRFSPIVWDENESYTAVYSETWSHLALNDDGESYCVTGIETNDKIILIPSTYDGKPVTAIGEGAFKDRTDITDVIIPDSVLSIGKDAFSGCTGLKNLIIGDGVTTVGENAFYNTTALASVFVGDGMTSLDCFEFKATMYRSDLPLENIVIGDGITKIGDNVFYGCQKLKSVTVGKNVESIGAGAFEECHSLRSIVLPDSVISIGEDAFTDCRSIEKIVLGKGLKSIGAAAFTSCEKLTSIVIPDSVTDMGAFLFSGCSKLGNLTFGPATTIDRLAFVGNYSLKSLYYTGSIEDWLKMDFGGSSGASYNYDEYGGAYFSPLYNVHNEANDYSGAVLYIDGNPLTDLIIPYSVTEITQRSFCGYASLESVVFHKNVKTVNTAAFGQCKKLNKIYFEGTESEKNITFYRSDKYSVDLESLTWYYYTETEPTTSGNFWHYVDGVPTAWTVD